VPPFCPRAVKPHLAFNSLPTANGDYTGQVSIANDNSFQADLLLDLEGYARTPVLLVDNNAFQESWATGADWQDELPARALLEYVVDGATGVNRLRTPHAVAISRFPGESLTLRNGAEVLIKAAAGGNITIDDLFIDAGKIISSYEDSTVLFNGRIEVGPGGIEFSGTPGPLIVNALVSGSGAIRQDDSDSDTTLNAGDWGGDVQLSAGTLRFGYDVLNGGEFAYTGGVFDLNGRDHIFSDLRLNGTALASGRYNSSELGNGFTGAGSITVAEALRS
jgi:hypothetical protein